jgi:hydrogenase nickel incorporation protein HypB
MFKASQVMLPNKIDLLPYPKFSVERCIAFACCINPAIQVFQVSAETKDGVEGWYGLLRSQAMDAPGSDAAI